MSLASDESERFASGYLGDEHVILGLLRGPPGHASSLLRGHGLDLRSARAELRRLSARGLTPSRAPMTPVRCGPSGSTWRPCASG